MSDFFIDFRQGVSVDHMRMANFLKYMSHINVYCYVDDQMSFLVTRADEGKLWSPYVSVKNEIIVALSGRIVLSKEAWARGSHGSGSGGIACEHIFNLYRAYGTECLKDLNGHFVVIVIDRLLKKVFIVTDHTGTVPCFVLETEQGPVFSSHPDVLASCVEAVSGDLDLVSLSEFVNVGKVNYPNSFYKQIKSADYATIYSIDTGFKTPRIASREKYFKYEFCSEATEGEDNLVEEFSASFKDAVSERSLPIFGQTAVSLSGGLDSRTILCCASDVSECFAFCFYDEENYEFQLARTVAKEVGVQFVGLKREFDYYGNNAIDCVRLTGGMGTIGANHYGGFGGKLYEMGVRNVLAGFYCDYLFKGLVLDKNRSRFTRRESTGDFNYISYDPHYWFDGPLSNAVKERLYSLFPLPLINDKTDRARIEIQAKRMFPLFLDSECPESVLPEKILGWYLPAIDRRLLEISKKMSPHHKLNASVFNKVVARLCDKSIVSIPNAYTGASILASGPAIILAQFARAFRRRLVIYRRKIKTDESWPNWSHYLNSSKKIEDLWMSNRQKNKHFLNEIVNGDIYTKRIGDYGYSEIQLFLRLLTLKLWLEVRNDVALIDNNKNLKASFYMISSE